MKIKAIYRKNLKMSEGKIAAQVAHAILGLQIIENEQLKPDVIIVLGVSDKKFQELVKSHLAWVQKDRGLTEVKAGTETAAAWIEE